MSEIRLTVIIPSRTQDQQAFFLRRSVKSVRDQTAASQFEITIVVAVDKGEMLDEALQIYRSHFRPSAILDKPYSMFNASKAMANLRQQP